MIFFIQIYILCLLPLFFPMYLESAANSQRALGFLIQLEKAFKQVEEAAAAGEIPEAPPMDETPETPSGTSAGDKEAAQLGSTSGSTRRGPTGPEKRFDVTTLQAELDARKNESEKEHKQRSEENERRRTERQQQRLADKMNIYREQVVSYQKYGQEQQMLLKLLIQGAPATDEKPAVEGIETILKKVELLMSQLTPLRAELAEKQKRQKELRETIDSIEKIKQRELQERVTTIDKYWKELEQLRGQYAGTKLEKLPKVVAQNIANAENKLRDLVKELASLPDDPKAQSDTLRTITQNLRTQIALWHNKEKVGALIAEARAPLQKELDEVAAAYKVFKDKVDELGLVVEREQKAKEKLINDFSEKVSASLKSLCAQYQAIFSTWKTLFTVAPTDLACAALDALPQDISSTPDLLPEPLSFFDIPLYKTVPGAKLPAWDSCKLPVSVNKEAVCAKKAARGEVASDAGDTWDTE